MNSDDRVREIVGSARLFVSGREGERVLTRIIIPKNRLDPPKITLKPTSKQFSGLQYVPNGILSLELRLGEEGQSLDFKVDQLWLLSGNRTYWSHDVQDCTFEVDPRGIQIEERVASDSSELRATSVRFWISPNRFLHPAAIVESDYLGNRRVEVIGEKCAILVTGHKLVFSKNYYWWGSDGVETSTSFNLVAGYEYFGESPDFEAENDLVRQDLDEFLLIVSLATRTRTACFGWDAVIGDRLCTRYLPDISIPTGFALSSLEDGLIDRSDQPEFFQHGYQCFISSPYRPSLRSAVYALTPQTNRVIENDFLAVFSAIEEIILQYRRSAGLEFIFSESAWIEIRSGIERQIKSSVKDGVARGRV